LYCTNKVCRSGRRICAAVADRKLQDIRWIFVSSALLQTAAACVCGVQLWCRQ
jgi:hypothetical protein